MKKLYCDICSKYINFGKPKITYFLEKTLVLSIVCSKCKNKDEKIFKEEESIERLKILGLISNTEEYQKNKIMNQEFRLKKNRRNKSFN